ncbi:MAG: beta-ketoacyl-[acyl-carrier-protein] synthase family protein [bacterium]|nr:beta-ketoacyl-[acyl-carrier-protein] synthase family protein [bacterium]
MSQRIVVTGLGVVSSIGVGREIFWDNLIKGKSGISPITAFDTTGHKTHVGGEVKDFNPADFISKKGMKGTGRASQLAIAATRLALEDAKLDLSAVSQLRTCVSLGTTMGEIQSFEKANHAWIKEGYDQIDISALFESPVYRIPTNVALEFNLKGRNRIFTTACAAGNYGIGYGFDLLRSGEVDLVIAGGSEPFSWIIFTGFNKLGATAPEKCQPFDQNRQGMIPGEGAGILILETLESALRRNAQVYAEILGYGLSCDAHHMTNPQVEGVAECMSNALREAAINPEDVDYISAHGTGTKHNDRTECAAIKKVIGDPKIAISSIKSMLGHTMGAASALEAITCCLAVQNDIIPPTINYETPDLECDIDCVPNVARKQRVGIALNNGFAFGGNNSCLVVKKYSA